MESIATFDRLTKVMLSSLQGGLLGVQNKHHTPVKIFIAPGFWGESQQNVSDDDGCETP